MAFSFSCPKCDKAIRLQNPLPPGKGVRCPVCKHAFRPAEDIKAKSLAPANPSKNNAAPADKDSSTRPEKKTNTLVAAPPARGSARAIVLLSVAVCLLLAGGGVAAYLLWPETPAPPRTEGKVTETKLPEPTPAPEKPTPTAPPKEVVVQGEPPAFLTPEILARVKKPRC